MEVIDKDMSQQKNIKKFPRLAKALIYKLDEVLKDMGLTEEIKKTLIEKTKGKNS